jgi:hypothetical protein
MFTETARDSWVVCDDYARGPFTADAARKRLDPFDGLFQPSRSCAGATIAPAIAPASGRAASDMTTASRWRPEVWLAAGETQAGRHI